MSSQSKTSSASCQFCITLTRPWRLGLSVSNFFLSSCLSITNAVFKYPVVSFLLFNLPANTGSQRPAVAPVPTRTARRDPLHLDEKPRTKVKINKASSQNDQIELPHNLIICDALPPRTHAATDANTPKPSMRRDGNARANFQR